MDNPAPQDQQPPTTFTAPGENLTYNQPWRNAGWMTITSVARILQNVPQDKRVVTVVLPENNKRIHIVQDPDTWSRLARAEQLNRGPDHTFAREVFGNVVFVEPYGNEEHREKIKNLSNSFSQHAVTDMTPRVAKFAASTVDELNRHTGQPVDLNQKVLAYLLTLGSEMMTGTRIDLSRYAQTFHSSIQKMSGTVGSPCWAALASRSGSIASLLAWGAKRARRALYPMALELIKASEADPSCAVAGILRRNKIEASGINATNMYGTDRQKVMDEVVMEVAATTFTTASLVMRTVKHLIDHPQALDELRTLMAQDFPEGFSNVKQLSNSPSIRKLFLIFLENLPVNVGARDATESFEYKDGSGESHQINAGDGVMFNLPCIQKKCLAHMQMLMDQAPVDTPILSFLNPAKNERNLPMFFAGTTICPGRFAAILEAMMFLGTLIEKCDLRWPDGRSPEVVFGPVNGLKKPQVIVSDEVWWTAPDSVWNQENPFAAPAAQENGSSVGQACPYASPQPVNVHEQISGAAFKKPADPTEPAAGEETLDAYGTPPVTISKPFLWGNS